MDRFSPPSLIPPTIASLLAAFCFAMSRIERFPDPARALFVLFGVILAGITLATGLDWLIYRGAIWLEDIKSALNAPVLELARAVSSMNHEQLAMMGMLSPVQMEARVAGEQVSYWLNTRMGNIPFGWVVGYLEQNQVSYPSMLAQHGLPDALHRDYIRWFTDLMVTNGWAVGAAGNKPAQWNISLAEVGRRLGIDG